jgi:hypothetical protein
MAWCLFMSVKLLEVSPSHGLLDSRYSPLSKEIVRFLQAEEGHMQIEVEINEHVADNFTRVWSLLTSNNQIPLDKKSLVRES